MRLVEAGLVTPVANGATLGLKVGEKSLCPVDFITRRADGLVDDLCLVREQAQPSCHTQGTGEFGVLTQHGVVCGCGGPVDRTGEICDAAGDHQSGAWV